jgi:tripartite-type tricarboxylate transporter receptor subunit TctC
MKKMFAAIAMVLFATTAISQTQRVPVPPLIKVVVPFGPGSGTDIYARAAAKRLAARLNTTVVVENRAGASTMLGADMVAKGPRDGSILLLTTPSTLTAAATLKSPPVDIGKDLTPISLLNVSPMVVVVSSKTDIKTPADLVAKAKAHPGEITYGSSGPGTMIHMAFTLFADAAQVKLTHIPYKGGSYATADTAAGVVDMTLGAYSTFDPLIKAGKLRLIGVTSSQPDQAFPGIPTMASVAPGFGANLWLAVFAPAGTPAPVAQLLNREFNEISASSEMREITEHDGATPMQLSLAEVGNRMKEGLAIWKKVAKESKIETD